MIKRTLYFGNPAYLSLRNAQMVIKMPEVEKSDNVAEIVKQESVCTIPIEDIGVVVLDHKQITLTQGLIEALMNNNCALISCNSRSMPVSLMLPLAGHTLQQERFTSQIEATLPLRNNFGNRLYVQR